MTDAADVVLEVDHLTVSTPHTTLVRDMSFTLRRGERLGLIGESGSGKSLTSLAVMGLLPDTLRAGGSIRFSELDRDVVGAGERALGRIRGRHMGMVFQEPMTALNPTMQIGPQVAETLLIHRTARNRAAARQRVVELLEGVQLPDPAAIARSYPHQLSGGQRQRVVLAIAMANEPELLICDEPTTALDVTVQAQMLDLIDEAVTRTDSALLFISHDLAVVASVCRRIVVLYGGEMIEAGPVGEVLTRPRHPYTRGLLAASDLEAVDGRGRLTTLPSTVFDYRDQVADCPYCSDPGRPASESKAVSRWVETEHGGYACVHDRLEEAA